MITSINHVTLAVQDVGRSFDFYVHLLDCRAEARWDRGAYLSVGELWLCLSLDDAMPAKDYTHFAFSVNAGAFPESVARLKAAGVVEWKSNSSAGNSFYFLDPDGHKLEIHDGNLAARLKSVALEPYDGWVRYPERWEQTCQNPTGS